MASSVYQLLVSIFNVKRGKLERDYSTNDLNSSVDQIAYDFDLKRDRVAN